MAKGYMILVEGSAQTNVVHRDFGYAMKEAKRLSNQMPDKAVMLFQLHKQFLAGKKIGCHIPQDRNNTVVRSDLILKEEL